MASDDEGGMDLFQEPADYFEPEKEATFATHQLLSGKDFTVRLVGHNPLWVRLSTLSGFKEEERRSLRQLLPRKYVLEGSYVWNRSIYGGYYRASALLDIVQDYHGTFTDVHRVTFSGMLVGQSQHI